jgi:hypothetical protein
MEAMLRVAIVMLLVCGCETIFPLEGPALHRKRIVIDQESAKSIPDFPLAIQILNDPALEAADPDGGDLRFTDADGNALDHELVVFDPTGEAHANGDRAFEAWVRIPMLPPEPITIFLDFGDRQSQPDRALDVWSSDLIGVWHMAETEDGARDSTRSGRRFQGPTQPNQVSGAVGAAQHFTDELSLCLPSANDIDFKDRSFTVSMWVMVPAATNIGSFDRAFDKGGSNTLIPGVDFELGIDEWRAHVSDGLANGTLPSESPGATMFEEATTAVDRWVHLAATLDRSATPQVLRGYGDGARAEEVMVENLGSLTTDDPTCIGKPGMDSTDFTGDVDEVIIASIAVPDAFLFVHHQNIANPDTMITITDE